MKKPISNKIFSSIAIAVAAVGIAYGASGLIDTRRDYPTTNRPRKAPPVLPSGPVQLVDNTKEAGIGFTSNNGAFGLAWIPETLGSGLVFFDYDSDGYQDIFFVNARDWTPSEIKTYKDGPGQSHFTKRGNPIPHSKAYEKTTGALYHNKGDGTFTDVTKGSGLDIEIYGMGAAAGDYDNDGRIDLLVTSLTRTYLFRNQFKGNTHHAFQEVAGQAGVQSQRWFTSAAFVDYDKDGLLDLFACRYVQWSQGKEVPAMYFSTGNPPKEHKTYSGPNSYSQDVSALFHNQGHGRFQDVSRSAGIAASLSSLLHDKEKSKTNSRKIGIPKTLQSSKAPLDLSSNGLGVAVCDYNRDSWPDFMVSNDFKPNFLFRNNKDGTFSEVARQTGVALGNNGATRAGMGIDIMDLEGKGNESIVVGNYTRQQMGFYQTIAREGNEVLYRDFAKDFAIDKPTNLVVTFGCAFVDIDNDTRPDIFAVNGHVRDDVDINPDYDEYGLVTRAQRPLFLWNQGEGQKFKDTGFGGGKPQPEVVGRGLAYADIDLDGDVDLLITCIDSPPLLLRNEGGKNNSIRLILEGTESNRSAIGASVEVQVGQKTIRRTVKSGSSYLSQSELPLTLGLGKASHVDTLNILWPSGKKTFLSDIAANQIIEIKEDQGITKQRKFILEP